MHSKNPILIFINALILTFIILFLNISIVHARSRAPLGHVYLQPKLLEENLSQLFMELIILKAQLKKFYNSIMLRSDLVIAGSNFIFFILMTIIQNFRP